MLCVLVRIKLNTMKIENRLILIGLTLLKLIGDEYSDAKDSTEGPEDTL